jgi:hydrogenase maturation factor
MASQVFQVYSLPPYNQTSCIATIIIATNGALDKIREKDARETAEILQDMSNANEQTGKVA